LGQTIGADQLAGSPLSKGSSGNRVGEPSFRFSIPFFVRRGEREVAASHRHGRPNFPMTIKMRTNPRLYPTSILPLQRGGSDGLFSHKQSASSLHRQDIYPVIVLGRKGPEPPVYSKHVQIPRALIIGITVQSGSGGPLYKTERAGHLSPPFLHCCNFPA
jgi:hypothetical protein